MKGRKEDDAVESRDESRYGEELLCANWNPVIDLLAASCLRTAAEARLAQPDLREEDVEGFLGRIYQAGS